MIGTCLPDLVFTTVAGTPLASMHVMDDASALFAFALGAVPIIDDPSSNTSNLFFNFFTIFFQYYPGVFLLASLSLCITEFRLLLLSSLIFLNPRKYLTMLIVLYGSASRQASYSLDNVILILLSLQSVTPCRSQSAVAFEV